MPSVPSSSTAIKKKTCTSTVKTNVDSLKSLLPKRKKKEKKKKMDGNQQQTLLLNPLLPMKE